MSFKSVALRAAGVGLAAAALTLGSSVAAQADGDGDCYDKGNLCVFDGTEWWATGGHYDLNDEMDHFGGVAWFGGGTGDLGDDVSSYWTVATPTSCTFHVLYEDADQSVLSDWALYIQPSEKRTMGSGDYASANNEASSYEKVC